MAEDHSHSYRYSQEKKRLEQAGDHVGIEALVAQELAFVQGNLVVADLPVLNKDGTHLAQENGETQIEAVVLPSTAELARPKFADLLQKTNRQKLQRQLSELFTKHSEEISEKFDAQKIKNRDPATIVSLINYLIAKEFTYWDEITSAHTGIFESGEKAHADAKIAAEIDSYSADQLLDLKKGVCRHFTLVAVELFHAIKDVDESGNLDQTEFYEVELSDEDDSLSADNGEEPHSALLMVSVGKNGEVVAALTDPTHLMGREETGQHENFSNLRLAKLVDILSTPQMMMALEKQISANDLQAVVQQQIQRIANIDFNQLPLQEEIDREISNLFERGEFANVVIGYFQVLEKLENQSPFLTEEIKDAGTLRAVEFLAGLAKDTLAEPTILLSVFSKLNPVKNESLALSLANKLVTLSSKLSNRDFSHDLAVALDRQVARLDIKYAARFFRPAPVSKSETAQALYTLRDQMKGTR